MTDEISTATSPAVPTQAYSKAIMYLVASVVVLALWYVLFYMTRGFEPINSSFSALWYFVPYLPAIALAFVIFTKFERRRFGYAFGSGSFVLGILFLVNIYLESRLALSFDPYAGDYGHIEYLLLNAIAVAVYFVLLFAALLTLYLLHKHRHPEIYATK